jgi:glycosyltransferase involved in cell wall biosynthesis
MPTISAVIITFNEEKNIERCLLSLQGVAEEIVVVDSNSTDNTEAICRKFGVQFVRQAWLGYGAQKNFANLLAAGDYILSMDADEALSDRLKKSILEIKQKPEADAYSMNRLNNYCGKKWVRHCGWYPDTKVRLWKKGMVEWTLDELHEMPLLPAGITVLPLTGDLLHYSYHTISEHITQLNRYADIGASAYCKKGGKVTIFKIIYKTAWKFIRDYFFKGGFLDGYYGFVICRISAFASFVKYVKARELQKQKS